MKDVRLEIVENISLTKDIYQMTLKGDLSEIKNPGEFVEVKLPDKFLRRPFSVARFDENTLVLIYKILGLGTKEMTSYQVGMKLDVLVGLGNGFIDLCQKPLLVAGGIGVAPFFGLIEKYKKMGIKPIMIYGERNKDAFINLNYLKENTELHLVTDDGSLGYHGNPVSYLKDNNLDFEVYYACGPNIMLKNLAKLEYKGYLSLEARMGCGFGACMGCTIKTTKGHKRVCKEGPVFLASEVIYEE